MIGNKIEDRPEYVRYALDSVKAPRVFVGWVAMFETFERDLDELVDRVILLASMVGGSDLAPRTCKNMLTEAEKKGWVYVIRRGKGSKVMAWVRLSEEGLAAYDAAVNGGDEG